VRDLKADVDRLSAQVADLTRRAGAIEGSPLGAIIGSFLKPSEFHKYAGDDWAPCDGRPVSGKWRYSEFVTGNLPDLRGVFIRGLNQFDVSRSPLREKLDPEDREAGTLQTDSIKRHQHLIGYGTADVGAAPSGVLWVPKTQRPGRVPSFFPSTISPDSGDPYTSPPAKPTEENGAPNDETRPKNVAVYYYIKVGCCLP
jgi:hypothetical protein